MKGNHFEDLEVGEVVALGSHHFSAADIKRFAAKYDPQPFHMDEEAAKDSMFGALCASGWHTAAVAISLLIKHRLKWEEAIRASGGKVAIWGPSPGFKDLKWIKPVYAGDTITYRSTRTAKVDLNSRPERGLNVMLQEGLNQKGELVFAVTGQILVPRRVPLAPPPA
jgi:acyl dehydratase